MKTWNFPSRKNERRKVALENAKRLLETGKHLGCRNGFYAIANWKEDEFVVKKLTKLVTA